MSDARMPCVSDVHSVSATSHATPEDGLVFACAIQENGAADSIGWDEIERSEPSAFVWIHLDYAGLRARAWLDQRSGLDPVTTGALVATETRPRSLAIGDGLLVILRGVNANPNADPEDMVSIRMWIEERRVITLRHRRLFAAQDLREACLAGRGPRDAGGFLVAICDRVIERIGVVIGELDDAVDALEHEVLSAEGYELRSKIAHLRRDAIGLRRHLAPQREALLRLVAERAAWLSDRDRMRLRELSDRLTRCVEDLDAARERAAVTRDELDTRLSERMNRTMYVLSIVTAIFLPLSLITGVLGLNVGGVPFTGEPSGFLIICSGLIVIAILLALVFRRMKWI